MREASRLLLLVFAIVSAQYWSHDVCFANVAQNPYYLQKIHPIHTCQICHFHYICSYLYYCHFSFVVVKFFFFWLVFSTLIQLLHFSDIMEAMVNSKTRSYPENMPLLDKPHNDKRIPTMPWRMSFFIILCCSLLLS